MWVLASISGLMRIEMDAVADRGEIVAWAVSEHVENAGVHSGDATMVLPPQKTYMETIKRIKDTARKIATSLEIGDFFLLLWGEPASLLDFHLNPNP